MTPIKTVNGAAALSTKETSSSVVIILTQEQIPSTIPQNAEKN